MIRGQETSAPIDLDALAAVAEGLVQRIRGEKGLALIPTVSDCRAAALCEDRLYAMRLGLRNVYSTDTMLSGWRFGAWSLRHRGTEHWGLLCDPRPEALKGIDVAFATAMCRATGTELDRAYWCEAPMALDDHFCQHYRWHATGKPIADAVLRATTDLLRARGPWTRPRSAE